MCYNRHYSKILLRYDDVEEAKAYYDANNFQSLLPSHGFNSLANVASFVSFCVWLFASPHRHTKEAANLDKKCTRRVTVLPSLRPEFSNVGFIHLFVFIVGSYCMLQCVANILATPTNLFNCTASESVDILLLLTWAVVLFGFSIIGPNILCHRLSGPPRLFLTHSLSLVLICRRLSLFLSLSLSPLRLLPNRYMCERARTMIKLYVVCTAPSPVLSPIYSSAVSMLVKIGLTTMMMMTTLRFSDWGIWRNRLCGKSAPCTLSP